MKITINDQRKISAVQEEFKGMFPHLKIEFFARPSKAGTASSRKLVSNNKTLLECRATHHDGIIEISPSMTADEVINNFSDVFELTAEIMRVAENGNSSKPVGDKLTLEQEDKLALER